MNPVISDTDVTVYHGDAVEQLRRLAPASAQTCVCSPPYWGLRDYGAPGQIGLEETPEAYVERLVEVFRAVRRVLRDDGTVWLNLGDSYNNRAVNRPSSHQGGLGFESEHLSTSWRDHAANGRARMSINDGVLKEKDLVGIPWMVAFALRSDGWYLRSDIVWAKPNPMPESVTDRPTKAHEYVFLLSKQPRYFYDADAIREPSVIGAGAIRNVGGRTKGKPAEWNPGDRDGVVNDGSRNVRSVWEIATQPTPEAHFATYPQELVRRCILAGTSEHGECSACGAPWRRVAETKIDADRPPARRNIIPPNVTKHGDGTNAVGSKTWGQWTKRETTGWEASCACDAPVRPQTVLDPFLGSGTTALVARHHGRRAVGVELKAEYVEIAARRLSQLSLLG